MARNTTKYTIVIKRESDFWKKPTKQLADELGAPVPSVYAVLAGTRPVGIGMVAAAMHHGYDFRELFTTLLREDLAELASEPVSVIVKRLPKGAPIRWSEVTRDMWAIGFRENVPGAIGAKKRDDVAGVAGGTQGTNVLDGGYAITWFEGWPKEDRVYSGIYVPGSAPATAWEALNRRFGLDWSEDTFIGTPLEGRGAMISWPPELESLQEILGVPENQRVPWTD